MKKRLTLLLFLFAGTILSAQDTASVRKPVTFAYVEQSPAFPGDSMMAFIRTNFHYPNLPEGHSPPTSLYVGFTVNKDGSLSDIAVVKPTGEPLVDAEIIRVFSIMPKWSPGMMNGMPVRVRMNQKIIVDIER